MILLSSIGCFNFRYDVSGRQDAWGAYRKDETYALRWDTFLMRVGSQKELALVPPSVENRGSGTYSSPRSIEEYRRDPVTATQRRYTHFTNILDVAGIVAKGTLFAPRYVKRDSGWSLWYGFGSINTIYGEIMTGEFRGAIVDLRDVSWFMEDKDILTSYVERAYPTDLKLKTESKCK